MLWLKVLRVQSAREGGGSTAIVADVCSVLESLTFGEGAASYGEDALMESAVALLGTMLGHHAADTGVVSGALGGLWSITCWVGNIASQPGATAAVGCSMEVPTAQCTSTSHVALFPFAAI